MMSSSKKENQTTLKRAKLQGVTGVEAVDSGSVRCYENYDPPYSVLFFPNEVPQKIRYVGHNMEFEAVGRNLEQYFEEVATGIVTLLHASKSEPDDPAASYIESVMINYRTI